MFGHGVSDYVKRSLQRSGKGVQYQVDEEWFRIPEAPNYAVSTLGRIKNETYNRLLKPYVNSYGYETVSLKTNSGQRTFSVHRLVAYAFVPGYRESITVNHIDGNKRNNHYHNLEWITTQENIQHAHENGLVPKGPGTRRGKSVLIVETQEEFSSISDCARQLHVTPTAVRYALHHSGYVRGVRVVYIE